MIAEDVVARARRRIGVRFRPQGREAEHGLDCIGVVTDAFGLTDVRRDYRVRWSDVDGIAIGLAASGFVPVTPIAAAPGDVLVVRAGHAQLHVVLLTPAGFIHADAGLGRVVEVPGAVPWPIAGAWRRDDTRDEGQN